MVNQFLSVAPQLISACLLNLIRCVRSSSSVWILRLNWGWIDLRCIFPNSAFVFSIILLKLWNTLLVAAVAVQGNLNLLKIQTSLHNRQTWPFPFPFLLAFFGLSTHRHSISYSVPDLVDILHCFLYKAKVPRCILLTTMPAKTLPVSSVNIHWSRCAGSCIHAGIGGTGGGVGRLGYHLWH